MTRSVFSRRTGPNYLFWGIALACLAVQVALVHVPLLQHVFHTSALTLHDWGIAVLVAASIVAVDEVRKLARCCVPR
jgi:Ca2+-transporting ATPase